MAFGTIYLGETFCSYISLGNYSVHDTVNVTIKVFFSLLASLLWCSTSQVCLFQALTCCTNALCKCLPQSCQPCHYKRSILSVSLLPLTKDNLLCQAELQTDRQTATLYDNSAAPLASLAPGQRHDFIIRCAPGLHLDLNLMALTLVRCSVTAAAAGTTSRRSASIPWCAKGVVVPVFTRDSLREGFLVVGASVLLCFDEATNGTCGILMQGFQRTGN